MKRSTLNDHETAFVRQQRAGRLATTDKQGMPHVVPVCYAYADGSFYVALDAKPKTVGALQLKRVRNILANPRAALVVDHYSDDWSELGYLLARGSALLIQPGEDEHRRAVTLLRERYDQYRTMPIDEQPVVALRVRAVTSWGIAHL